MQARGQSGLWVALAAGAALLGVVSAVAPVAGLILIAVAAYAGLAAVVHRSVLPFATLGVLLMVPLDSIEPFAASFRAVPNVAVVLFGVLVGTLATKRRVWPSVRGGWDVMFMAAVLVLVAIAGQNSGGYRQAAVLMTGLLFYAWVRVVDEDPIGQRRAFLWTAATVGALQGAGAVLERLVGAGTFIALIPGYKPVVKEFAYELGGRAVSFAGHPLRLGTLCMIGLLAGVGLMRSSTGRTKRTLWMFVVASSAGLLLSGARGAWLGTVAGLLALMMMVSARHSFRLLLGSVAALAVGYFVLLQTGLFDLIQERLFGAAYRPASLEQRVNVLAASGIIWLQKPLLGWGFGDYLDQVFAQGFRYSNTENEYVNALLASGALGFVALITITVRALSRAIQSRRAVGAAAVGAVLVGLAVNIGTYNMFSWSTAFSLFMAVVALTHGAADESTGSAGQLPQ